VVRTRVGYTGGTAKNPTYYKIGDHTESLQIDYDPKVTSYQKLLDVFWATHNPCAQSGSRQYMTAVFYHSDAQKKLALETKAREAARRKGQIVTDVLPASTFYLAEDYHQKYYLRQHPDLLKEFTTLYPDTKSFLASTAVARVNGYLDGKGTLEALQKEIDGFGLSKEGSRKLLAFCKQKR